MAIKIAIQLIPLETLSSRRFDVSRLPFEIMPNVEVADVSELLPSSMFDYMKAEVGLQRMRSFYGLRKYALVHRYEEHTNSVSFEESNKIVRRNDELLNEIFACSRILRPTRRQVSVTGYVTTDGKVNQQGATFPDMSLDVPEGLKLFAFRNEDLENLRELVVKFLTAIHGNHWAFRMAVEYYNRGYEVNDWKGRYLYWGSSALHALYSPNSKKFVKRIKAFLGQDTTIYPPGEHPEFEFLGSKRVTIGEVIDEINDVRNYIAHGERIPDKYFRADNGRDGKHISVLDDALAFLVRETLRRILAEDLLDEFMSRQSVSAFWKTRNL